jgi:hypothetical protein
MGEGGIIVLTIVATALFIFLSMLVWLMQPEEEN